MPFTYAIRAIQFSDKTRIELSNDDIVVLVGPNNAGKSVALREIPALLPGTITGMQVVKQLEVEVSSGRDAIAELTSKLDSVANNPTQVFRMGNELPLQALLENAGNARWLQQVLQPVCVYHVQTINRLRITEPVDMIDLLTQAKRHPFHYLYDDRALELELSAVFAKAFDKDLVVNRAAGRPVHLHVGKRPSLEAFDTSVEAHKQIMQLPVLAQQGDGMKAFVGCLLWVAVVDYPIVLIDEPEAFLHPPQARIMGKTLVHMKRNGQQLILATHSGDLLRGILDGQPKNVKILRLTRREDVNVVRELRNEQIKELWSDPILRHSNTLDGLFHTLVVLCESDADCQFYSATANALADASPGRPSPDAMFIHCGGKDRMPKVVKALRAVDVPVRVIVDFDVLREQQPLRGLVESLGGDWTSFEADWKTIRNAISMLKAQLDTKKFKEQIEASLSKITGDVVPDSVLGELREHSRNASAWSLAKKLGKAFIPPGGPDQAYDRLSDRMAKIGLHIVPVGELEGFWKGSNLHGPAWVLEALNRDLAADPKLRDAREFIEPIVAAA
jgi:hypothetical protein